MLKPGNTIIPTLLALASCGEALDDQQSSEEQRPPDDFHVGDEIIAQGLRIVDEIRAMVEEIANADDVRRLVPLNEGGKPFDIFDVRAQSQKKGAFVAARGIPGEPGETGDMGILNLRRVDRPNRDLEIGYAGVNWQPGQFGVRPDSMMGEVSIGGNNGWENAYWRRWINDCLVSDEMPVPDEFPGEESHPTSLEACRRLQDATFQLIVDVTDLEHAIPRKICLQWGPDDTTNDDEQVVPCPEGV